MKNKRPKPYKYERLSSEIERLVSEVISYEIKDPRVLGNCDVSGIVLSKDYSHCKVYIEIKSENKKEVMDGLKNSSGYLGHIVRDQLDLRKTMEFSFIEDESKKKMDRINELLEQIK